MIEIVHCLNLDRREDRLLAVSKEAKQQGFAVYFHTAIDAAERKDTSTAITKGHKSIIQFAKDNNLPYCLVAEDDLFFYGNDNKAFQYFMDNMPKSFDLYMGCIYHGTVDENNRVLNGMSGSHTLLCVHSRFYNFFLNEMPDNCYQDRYCGDFAFKYEYYVCPLIVCGQRKGYSDHLREATSDYEIYLENRKVYGRDEL